MGTIQHAVDALLNEYDVAGIIGMSVASVRRWRTHNAGPQFIKIGSAVRYRLDDIQSFINKMAEQTKLRRPR